MRYFKRINHGTASIEQPWKIGIIYPEDSHPDDIYISTEASVKVHSDRWQEVSAREYWEQEIQLGKLVKGGYYTVKKTGVVFKHDGTAHSEYYLGSSSVHSGVDSFCRDNGCFTSDVESYRVATDDEIEWLEACNKADKFISKEKFMQSREFVLPTKWKIKDCEVVAKFAQESFDCAYTISDRYLCVNQDLFPAIYSYAFLKDTDPAFKEYTEITFEQFEKYILNKNMKDKKIIGYILKDPQYYKAASMIAFGNTGGSFYWTDKKPDNRPQVINKLKESEVLDLWFEPVYEKDTFQSGDYVKWEGVYSFCIGVIDKRRTDVKEETYILTNVFTSFKDNVYTHCSVKHLTPISKEEYEQKVLDFLKEWFIKIHNIDSSKTYDVVFSNSSAKNVKLTNFKLAVRGRSEGFWAGHTYNWFDDHKESNYQLVVVTTSGTFRPDCIVTESVLYPEVTIRDYDAKFTKDSVSFGCQTYSKEFVLQLGDFLEKSGLILDYGVQVMKVVKHFREQK